MPFLKLETLTPEDLSQFLMRHRRGETLERFEPRLDNFLREILAKANEFVPSESGAFLLDNPREKMLGQSSHQLTLVAAFGEHASQMIGQKMACNRGIAGRVYISGRSTRCTVEEEDKDFYAELDAKTGLNTQSLLGVPVILGNSICGVLQLINRLGRIHYTEEECTLMEIFAGYISSSIQNILDGIRAKELARRDDLTGLFNDRYFHFRLREEIGRADTEKTDISLIFLDLDRFKEINDQHGHLEGSRTLHELGILLQSSVPPHAIVARYGGDEFVIILPKTTTEKASEVAYHLQRTIASAPFLNNVLRCTSDIRTPVSASIGVASLDEHVPNVGNIAQRANTLIRMADSAMYRAKAEGRNRVVVAFSRTKEYPIATPAHREPSDTTNLDTSQPGRRSDPSHNGHLPGATDPLRDPPGHRRSG